MPDSYDLDRGLLLAVQAIQVRGSLKISSEPHVLKITISRKFIFICLIEFYLLIFLCFQALLENKGVPVMVGIGNPDTSSSFLCVSSHLLMQTCCLLIASLICHMEQCRQVAVYQKTNLTTNGITFNYKFLNKDLY